MNKIYMCLFLLLVCQHAATGQSIVDLSPSQSMSITGKGPGQDAVKNPYSDGSSTSIIENIGANDFSIRVQKNGEIKQDIVIKPKETKRVNLWIGYELYFDSEFKAKAKVSFEQIKE